MRWVVIGISVGGCSKGDVGSQEDTGDGAPALTDDTAPNAPCSDTPTVAIEAPFAGDLYLDGRYAGLQAPIEVPRWQGARTVAVGGGASGYVSQEIDPAGACTVTLSAAALAVPRPWRALYLTLRNVTATLPGGSTCTATLDQADADVTFDNFVDDLQTLVPYSHGTMAWETERREVQNPFTVRDIGWTYAPLPADVEPLLADVEPGSFDLVVVFYRSTGTAPNGTVCTIPANYLGLALPPTPEAKGAGFVTVTIATDEPLAEWWEFLDTTAPGTWIHEWLHTVLEAWVAPGFYPGLGALLPQPGEDESIVHNGEAYGYDALGVDWYSDLVAGRVADGDEHLGITPAWLLRCTVRDGVVGDEACRPR